MEPAGANFQDELPTETLASTEHVIKKYNWKIVEEGFLKLRIVLEPEGKSNPTVEVQIDGQLVGYINEFVSNRLYPSASPNLPPNEDVLRPNEGVFRIECYKRSNGQWDKRTILITPVGSYARSYGRAHKTIRLGASAVDENKPVPVYIGLKLLRTWYTFYILKKRPPKREWSGAS